jgi:hypothetical protein
MADRGQIGTHSSQFQGQTLGPDPAGRGELKVAFRALVLVGVAGHGYGLVRRRPLVVLAAAAAMWADRKPAFGGHFG